MSTPVASARPLTGCGGATSPSKQQLISFAREVCNNCGIDFSENKIVRLVRRFKSNTPRASGWTFFLYLTAQAQLSHEKRRIALLDPDIARYFRRWDDPTGEDAVAAVLRERGY